MCMLSCFILGIWSYIKFCKIKFFDFLKSFWYNIYTKLRNKKHMGMLLLMLPPSKKEEYGKWG
jgi:hypothetical protein